MVDEYDYENKKITEHKEYLDHILDDINPEIRLDDDQRRAVVSNAERALVIAGAGTGKTTTMVARVKYLVDKMHVDPHKILVLSFARKNVRELRDLIWTDLNISADVNTFHSLGFKYLRKASADRGKNCFVVDERDQYCFFERFLREKVFVSKEKIISFYNSFHQVKHNGKYLFRGFFDSNYDKFSSFNDYFSALVQDRIAEWGDVDTVIEGIKESRINNDTPLNMKHEWFRSKGEAAISNFLLEHNIKYDYEKFYEEVLPDDVPMRPDFTLHIGGEEIIVEYFGLYEEGDDVYFKSYKKERELKIARFERDHKKYIALEFEPNYGYLDTLKRKLEEFGFSINRLSSNEIADIIIRSDPLHDFYIACNFFNSCVETVKASMHRNDFIEIAENRISEAHKSDFDVDPNIMREQFKFIRDYFSFYQRELRLSGDGVGIDYSDMIYFAKMYIKSMDKRFFAYDHVLIDEYQDISFDRYELTLKTLEHGGANLMAVGDDWQSIYGFTGSRIEYTYHFAEYYSDKDVKKYFINHTYRFSNELADITSEFIKKNPDQIQDKELYSEKHLDRPIRIREFSSGFSYEERIHNEVSALANLIEEIHTKHPDDKIMVLSRSNYAIDQLFEYEDVGFKDEVENRVSLKRIPDFMFEVRTIHKSKGATSDWTIVFGLNASFPRGDKPGFWFLDLFKHKTDIERYPYAEERRVFYVALTRTRNCTFLLKCNTAKYCSPFVNEILGIEDEYSE